MPNEQMLLDQSTLTLIRNDDDGEEQGRTPGPLEIKKKKKERKEYEKKKLAWEK